MLAFQFWSLLYSASFYLRKVVAQMAFLSAPEDNLKPTVPVSLVFHGSSST